MRGIGLAASVLIGLVAVANIVNTATDWWSYTALRDYQDGNATIADLEQVDAVTALVTVPMLLLQLAAGVVFIVWLYRARINAERLTYATEHRRSRVWVWLGWFVPIVNFWFPKQIVDDVWRASDPRQQTVPLQDRRRAGLTTVWWAAFLVTQWLDRIYTRIYLREELTPDLLQTAAVVSSVGTVSGLVAALLGVQVVVRISDFQTVPFTPPPTVPETQHDYQDYS
ncbi:hypothetical protein Lesp02_16760 [Lentzea sp. NBRC 105346]|nr:hypothetical protein Lesp02_16760 [Lentzea sp. NBRC 105346]